MIVAAASTPRVQFWNAATGVALQTLDVSFSDTTLDTFQLSFLDGLFFSNEGLYLQDRIIRNCDISDVTRLVHLLKIHPQLILYFDGASGYAEAESISFGSIRIIVDC